jgi:hypothetical protein
MKSGGKRQKHFTALAKQANMKKANPCPRLSQGSLIEGQGSVQLTSMY